MLNQQDRLGHCTLLLSIAFEGKQFEMGHVPDIERPYITWEVRQASPARHYNRSYFYTASAALADVQRRIESALYERIAGLAIQFEE